MDDRCMRDPGKMRGNRCGALATLAALLVSAVMAVLPAQAANGASDPGSRIKPHASALDLPAFRVFTASGQAVSNSSLTGRITVLNIWATWCSPCLRELPSLDRLQEKLGGKVRVLAVSQDREGASVASPYLHRLGIRHLETLYDREATLTAAFRARVLPVTVILNQEGRELARVIGDLDWADASVVHFLGQLAGR